MLKKILIATKNAGKAEEFKKIFSEKGISISTLLDLKDVPEIEENGKTFTENALIKAKILMNKYDIPVLADDSGIVVDYLNGRPGIYSARYAGDHDDDDNKKKLLSELEGVPTRKRTAHFHCSLVIASPKKSPLIAEGNVQGYIAKEPAGNSGFGYDPIFFYPPLDKTFGELLPEEKNKISHRANAIKELLTKFDKWREE